MFKKLRKSLTGDDSSLRVKSPVVTSPRSASVDESAEQRSESPSSDRFRMNTQDSIGNNTQNIIQPATSKVKPFRVETHAKPADEKELLKQMPPIIRAVFSRDLLKFQELLSKKKRDISAIDKVYKRNVYHWCAVKGASDMVQLLLSGNHKDTVDLLASSDIDGRSPLVLAVIYRQLDILQNFLAINTASANSSDNFGKKPIEYAVQGDDALTCKTLMETGASAEVISSNGKPLLMWAMAGGAEGAALAMIEMNANISIRDSKSRNLFHYAIHLKSIKLVDILLRRGLNPGDCDNDGRSPLDSVESMMRSRSYVNNTEVLLKLEQIKLLLLKRQTESQDVIQPIEFKKTSSEFKSEEFAPSTPLPVQMQHVEGSSSDPHPNIKKHYDDFNSSASLFVTSRTSKVGTQKTEDSPALRPQSQAGPNETHLDRNLSQSDAALDPGMLYISVSQFKLLLDLFEIDDPVNGSGSGHLVLHKIIGKAKSLKDTNDQLSHIQTENDNLRLELENINEKMKNQISQARNSFHATDMTLSENAELKKSLIMKDAELADLKSTVIQLQDGIKQTQTMASQLEHANEDLNHESQLLSDKDREIAQLKSELTAAQQQHEQLYHEHLSLMKKVNENLSSDNEVKSLIAAKDSELDVLWQGTASMPAYIDILRNHVEQERQLRLQYETSISAYQESIEALDLNLKSISDSVKEYAQLTATKQAERTLLDAILDDELKIGISTSETLKSISLGVANLKIKLKQKEESDKKHSDSLSAALNRENKLKHQYEAVSEERNTLTEMLTATDHLMRERESQKISEIHELKHKVAQFEEELEEKRETISIIERKLEIQKTESELLKMKLESELADLTVIFSDIETGEDKSLKQKANDIVSLCKFLQGRKSEMEQQLFEVQTTVSNQTKELAGQKSKSQVDNDEKEILRNDVEKAKDFMKRLQSKINDLTAELSQRKSLIEELNAKLSNSNSDRERLSIENVKIQARLNEEIVLKQAFEATVQSISNEVDQLGLQSMSIGLSSNLTPDSSNISADGIIRIEDHLFEVEKAISNYKRIIDIVGHHAHAWKEKAGDVANEPLRKCILMLCSNFETIIPNQMHNQIGYIEKNVSRTLSCIQALFTSTKAETTKAEHALVTKYQEVIGGLNTTKALLEQKLNDQAHTHEQVSKKQEEMITKLEYESRNWRQTMDDLKAETVKKTSLVTELEKKLSEYSVLQRKSQEQHVSSELKLEQASREYVAKINILEREISYLKNELQERDPDFMDEYQSWSRNQEKILHIKSESGRTSNNFVAVPRPLTKRDSIDKTDAIKALSSQVSLLEQEYKQANSTWELAKKQIEVQNHEVKSEVLDKLEQHQAAFDNLEKSLKRSAKKVKTQAGDDTQKLITKMIERLDFIQSEREQLESLRKDVERKTIDSYEMQIRTLQHDMELLRMQLENALNRSSTLESLLREQLVKKPQAPSIKISKT